MHLLYSTTSPYARKLRVIIAELGLEARVDFVAVAVMEDPAVLRSANPLTKVPALVTGPGATDAIFDSPVIAAYLLDLVPTQALLPASGDAHWAALTIEALCDGILDAAIGLRFEAAAGGSDRSPFWAARMRAAIDNAVLALPARLAAYEQLAGSGFGYAQACAVVALEYLDFRFPEIDWRAAAPDLLPVHRRWADRPALASTRPA
jgi:glutathione S-transferase